MTPSLTIDGRIAVISLQRPELANKLTPEDLPAIRAHVDEINRRDSVLLLQIRSTGRHFCSGYDIGQVQGSQSEGQGFGEMVDALENCRAVTMAVLQGGVYGGATDLALACDFRVGSDRCEMFMPAARLGLHYYLSGMERSVSRLGLDIAKRLFLTAERLDAAEMKACGFLTHLLPADALDSGVTDLSSRITAMAPLALLGMKRHLNQIARGTVDARAVREAVLQTLASDDLREGATAWKEKRPPRFSGR